MSLRYTVNIFFMYLYHLCILHRWNNTVYLILNISFKLKSISQEFVLVLSSQKRF